MKTRAMTSILPLVLSLAATACAPKGHVTEPQFENGQYTFADPDQAADALKDAVEKQDKQELARIFGPQSGEVISSGDEYEDQETMRAFAKAMDEKVKVVETENANPALKNQQIAFLVVGDQEYPFPIAMFRQANGWRFDTEVGKHEIIDRRIGRNEIRAIKFLNEYVDAQNRYRAMTIKDGKPPQFARKFFSSPGKHDGLYWEEEKGKPMSPMGPLVAAASDEGYSLNALKAPIPYDGYRFDILTRQGAKARGGAMSYLDGNGRMSRGFALIAYPAYYGVGGVVTFMVGPDGVIYQKNLGSKTTEIARTIQSFDPDLSWVPVR